MASVLASCGNAMEKDSRQEIYDLSDFLSEHCQWPVECLPGAELNVTYELQHSPSSKPLLDTIFRQSS